MDEKKHIDKEKLDQWLSENEHSPTDKDTIDSTEDALIGFAESHSLHPPKDLREKILEKMNRLNAKEKARSKLSLEKLPILSAESHHLDWKEVVASIPTPDLAENVHLHPLVSDGSRELFVMWAQGTIPEEVHDDLLESFMILEGSCECHITGADGNSRIVRLGEGDFIEMQLHEKHDIVITSLKPGKAILQRIKLSA